MGEKREEEVTLDVIEYDTRGYWEGKLKKPDECRVLKENDKVSWINITGVHEVEMVKCVGEAIDLHPLVMEDIMDTEQRPKVETYDGYIFVVLRMPYLVNGGKELVSEQVSMILGDTFVVTFQERKGDVFDPIRDRIKGSKGRIRAMGPDYLAYALIDAIVDNYFIMLEEMGERIEKLEEVLVKEPREESLKSILSMKRQLITMRRTIWPLREVISSLQREGKGLIPTGGEGLIKEETGVFLRDLYDHTVQVMETLEGYRDVSSGMVDLYMSSVSNRMNEVMKVLTVIATIFIPLTFIAGVYGMNFRGNSPFSMPELDWDYGYPAVIAVMVIVFLLMLIYFRRKHWI